MEINKEPRPHADQRYIQALLTNDHAVLKEIYKKFSGKVVSYVNRNNGDQEDARDVIQETLVTIYQQARDKKLVLTCPFDAYFFLLCKRRWLNKLKAKKGVTIDETASSIPDVSPRCGSATSSSTAPSHFGPPCGAARRSGRCTTA